MSIEITGAALSRVGSKWKAEILIVDPDTTLRKKSAGLFDSFDLGPCMELDTLVQGALASDFECDKPTAALRVLAALCIATADTYDKKED